jgi:polar amino acid transport system permease protein
MNFDPAVFWTVLTSSWLWKGAWITLLLALVTYGVSLLAAVPLALAKISDRRWLRTPAAAWVWLLRGIPLIVLLIFVYNALPVAVPALEEPLSHPFLSSAIALVLGESAYIAEALRTGLLAVEKDQRDAGRALGFRPLTVQRVVVLPIALRVSVPALGNEFISNLKNTSLASVISLVELTLAGQRLYTQNFAVLETMCAVAALYLLMFTVFSFGQRLAEARLSRHMQAATHVGRLPDAPPPADPVTLVPEARRGTLRAEARPAAPETESIQPGGPMATEVVLEAREVSKSYGHHEVLRRVSLQVHRSEVCVILGRSGSGKSTLLRCLNRLETPDSGVVLLNGHPLGYHTSRDDGWRPRPERAVAGRRRELGMVFQGFSLFPQLTAAQNVTVAPRTYGMVTRRAARDYAMPFLAEVGMDAHADKYPGQLSGGQQQRVAIARALAMRPGAILLDEPTSALDPESIREVLLVLRQLAMEGRTMGIVSHELGFASSVADTVVFMADGEIVEHRSAAEFFTEPESEKARSFLSSAGRLP